MLTLFVNYLKYSFVNFPSIFSSFKCLYIVRFEWGIVLSSSNDGWDKRGYTTWCPRERYFYSSKLCLIVSKGGTNSADSLGFYF